MPVNAIDIMRNSLVRLGRLPSVANTLAIHPQSILNTINHTSERRPFCIPHPQGTVSYKGQYLPSDADNSCSGFSPANDVAANLEDAHTAFIQLIDKLLANPSIISKTFLRREGRDIGYCNFEAALAPASTQLTFIHIYVAPEERGAGLGDALFLLVTGAVLYHAMMTERNSVSVIFHQVQNPNYRRRFLQAGLEEIPTEDPFMDDDEGPSDSCVGLSGMVQRIDFMNIQKSSHTPSSFRAHFLTSELHKRLFPR